MINLLQNCYKTYFDQALKRQEKHWPRLIIFAIFSFTFYLFAASAISNVYSMMATGVTVLTGFTFTALFSDHALAASGLPDPKNENDRLDLTRLGKLSNNFRARSSYFITLSILEIALLVGVSFDFSTPTNLKAWIGNLEIIQSTTLEQIGVILSGFAIFFSGIFSFSANFIYLECLYTFYRMAETILAILDIRRDYLKAREQSN